MRIAIDPGHGGRALGGVYKGVLEKNLNMSIANLLHAKLDGAYLLRKAEDTLNLQARREAAKEADLVISIHCNANPHNWAIRGAEAYIWPHDPDKLRKDLASDILDGFPECLHPVKIFVTGPDDWRKRAHAVVGTYEAPCILIECGYMSNSQDLEILQSPMYQGEIACGIAKGIEKWKRDRNLS